MAIRPEVTRADTGTAAATGIARRRVPPCHHAAIPAAIQVAMDEDHPLVRNWICTSRSCGVRLTVAGTAAIAARPVTADLGLAMAEAAVPRVTGAAVHLAMVEVAVHLAMVEVAVHLATVEAAMHLAAVVVTRAVAEATRVEVAVTLAAEATPVVVIAKRKMATS